MKAIDVFRMPTPVSVMGRSSSITNSFINGIIPCKYPSDDDVTEALEILKLNPDDLRCSYCGDRATEWDHLRALISGQEPTGYISEIQNLVPACGKCNQSKGNTHWRTWMNGNAKLCPRVRCVSDIEDRINRLELFERWREPTKLDIKEIVGGPLWEAYRANWRQLLESMSKSQELAVELKGILASAIHGVQKPARASQLINLPTNFRDQMDSDEKRVVLSRITQWAAKPNLKVHRIIGIVVRAGGSISRNTLIMEIQRATGSKNAYGAIASLLTSKGNAYGRVFEDVNGMIRIHPDVEPTVRAKNWT